MKICLFKILGYGCKKNTYLMARAVPLKRECWNTRKTGNRKKLDKKILP